MVTLKPDCPEARNGMGRFFMSDQLKKVKLNGEGVEQTTLGAFWWLPRCHVLVRFSASL